MVLPFLSLMVLEREAVEDAELPSAPEELEVAGVGEAVAPDALLLMLLPNALLLIAPPVPPDALLLIASLDVLLPIAPLLLMPEALLSIAPPLALLELALLELALLALESPLALLSIVSEVLFSVVLLSVVVLVVLLPPLLLDVWVVVVVSASSPSPLPFKAYQAAPAKAAKTMAPNTRFLVLPFSPSKRGTEILLANMFQRSG